MLKVHNEGQGVCGVYTFEVAETKAAQNLLFPPRPLTKIFITL